MLFLTYPYFSDSAWLLVTANLDTAVTAAGCMLFALTLRAAFSSLPSPFSSPSYACMGLFAYLYFGDSALVLVTANLDAAGAAAGLVLLRFGSLSLSLSDCLSLLVALSSFSTVPVSQGRRGWRATTVNALLQCW